MGEPLVKYLLSTPYSEKEIAASKQSITPVIFTSIWAISAIIAIPEKEKQSAISVNKCIFSLSIIKAKTMEKKVLQEKIIAAI